MLAVCSSHTLRAIQNKEFAEALLELNKDFEVLKRHPSRGSNKYVAGITAHNIAVLYVLSDQNDMALPLFTQALSLKRAAFGETHPYVAVSTQCKHVDE